MNFAKPDDNKQYYSGYTDMWRIKENKRNGQPLDQDCLRCCIVEFYGIIK